MTDTRKAEVSDAVARYPAAAWYLRLPIIRHVRALIATRNILRYYRTLEAIGVIPFNADIDFAIRDAIWKGEK